MKCRNRVIGWGALVTAVSALNVSPASANPAAPGAKTAGGAVAVQVNNEKILVSDVDRLVNAIKADHPELATGTEQANKSLAGLRESVLENLIVQHLLAQEAQKRKITAPKADVDAAIVQIRGKSTEAELTKELAKEGKTLQDLRQLVSKELAIRELTKQMTSDVVVTDDNIAKYYRDNPEQFIVPETVRARHVLIALKPGGKPADKEAARAKAQNVLKLAQAKNADFGKLARENSDDTGSKEEGGDLGPATRGMFVKPFEDAIFSSQAGKVVGPVETEFGFHIIKVEEKAPSRTLQLNEVKTDPRLKELVRAKLVRERFDQKVAALRKQATIR